MENNPLHVITMDLWTRACRLANPRVALDIGANDGGYTQTLLNEGMEKVYAFEPVPSMYDKLIDRHGRDRRVICVKKMVSDYPGTIKDLTVLTAWTLGKPNEYGLTVSPEFVGRPHFDAEMTTVDEFMGGAPAGILKIDVDGYEHKVLSGAMHTLKLNHPPILIELSEWIEKVSKDVKSFIDAIHFLGYVLVSMDGSYVARTWEEVEPYYPYHSSFDVMLIHKTHLPAYL